MFQRILPVAKMIKSKTQVEKEPFGIIKSLPRIQPFDLSIRLDHSLDSGSWRVPFSRIGFDVVLIHSTQPSSSSQSEAAKYTETDLRLRYGEKMKFARSRGSTNPITKQTIPADNIIGELMTSNNVFLPIAVGPHGELGSIFRRFLQGDDALALPTFQDDRPNAKLAAERAISSRTPFDVLGKANKSWFKTNGHSFFGGTYLSSTPELWANQQLGLTIQTHLATHIKCSLNKIKYNFSSAHASESQSEQILEEEVLDWKVFDGPLTFGNSSNDILHDIHEADALRMVDPKGSTGRTSDDISKARSVVR